MVVVPCCGGAIGANETDIFHCTLLVLGINNDILDWQKMRHRQQSTPKAKKNPLRKNFSDIKNPKNNFGSVATSTGRGSLHVPKFQDSRLLVFTH
jgi:hypothetical protein